MYEELAQNLRAIDEYESGYAKLMWDAADAIEDLTAQLDQANEVIQADSDYIYELSKPKWIPVTEGLPEVWQWVLCQCRAKIKDVLRLTEDGYWYRDTLTTYMPSFVTHWMPLPEPPEEE